MSKAQLIVRILLGLMLVIFGLNMFLQLMTMPPMAETAGEFMGALVKSGYIMVIVAMAINSYLFFANIESHKALLKTQ